MKPMAGRTSSYEQSCEAVHGGKGQKVSGYVDRGPREWLMIPGEASGCSDQSSDRFQFMEQIDRADLNRISIRLAEDSIAPRGNADFSSAEPAASSPSVMAIFCSPGPIILRL